MRSELSTSAAKSQIRHVFHRGPPFDVAGMRALDVGCGSGYLSAVMARMVGIEGQVVAIDYLSPLVALSLENVRKEDADLLDSVLVWIHRMV